MSVKQEANGRRSVQVEFEVPGTPEEVWQAIATGPGISAWFVPAEIEERDGKPVALKFKFGPGMESRAPLTAWDRALSPRYKDSSSIHFSGGNPWREVGTWTSPFEGTLSALGTLSTWVGLKNSDDQGTRFDILAETYRNQTLVASASILCVTGVARNPALAKEVVASFPAFDPTAFDGAVDSLRVRILTRIGTNPDATKCGGHDNATGLRLYFDAAGRESRLGGVVTPN